AEYRVKSRSRAAGRDPADDSESSHRAHLAADRADPGVRRHLLRARCVAGTDGARLDRHVGVRACGDHRLARRMARAALESDERVRGLSRSGRRQADGRCRADPAGRSRPGRGLARDHHHRPRNRDLGAARMDGATRALAQRRRRLRRQGEDGGPDDCAGRAPPVGGRDSRRFDAAPRYVRAVDRRHPHAVVDVPLPAPRRAAFPARGGRSRRRIAHAADGCAHRSRAPSATLTPIVSIRGLSKTYASGFRALGDVDLDINRGEILALLGPNGAGKTTLISIVCGIVNPTSGTVRVDGHDIVRDYRAARAMIGLVPQELTTDAFETPWNALSFSRGLFGKPADPAHVEKVLRDLSLWEKRDQRIMTLSG